MNATISMTNKLRGTVSMANSKINGGASPYPKTAGPAAIITITDGAENTPLKSCVVNIEPVQSGSGDPSPTNIRPISGWTQAKVTRAGKNLANVTFEAYNAAQIISNLFGLEAGTYTLSLSYNGTPTWGLYLREGRQVSTAIKTVYNTNTMTFTLDRDYDNLCISMYYGSGITPSEVSDVIIVQGSTAAEYVAPNITTDTISFGQTVYGGTLDVVRGKLNAKPYYASYSGQTLVGPWISSHDKYVAGATPTTGAQVVDMGAAGTDYDVTPQTVKTLLGVNNIWADAGNTTLEYYPAAASIVSVLNRSSKVYTSIPLGKIRYETYQITPQQTIDLDSYRSENGNLLRNPVATKCKIEFNTPLMTDSEWAEIWNIIKAGFNNNTERKLKLRYYDTLSATYKTGYFYVPDVQTTIRNIEEGAGVINYNEIRIAFIEY